MIAILLMKMMLIGHNFVKTGRGSMKLINRNYRVEYNYAITHYISFVKLIVQGRHSG